MDYKLLLGIVALVIGALMAIKMLTGMKVGVLKNLYMEEFNNIDMDNVQGYEKYKRTVSDDANIKDFVPKKTSELDIMCDEEIGQCYRQ